MRLLLPPPSPTPPQATSTLLRPYVIMCTPPKQSHFCFSEANDHLCTSETSSVHAEGHLSFSQQLVAAVKLAEEKEADVRTYLTTLSRVQLLGIIKTIDPLRSFTASKKKTMLDYLLAMPISEMYDRISAPLVFSHLIRCRSGCTRKSLAALPIDQARVFVQRRVSSPAGPGLAYFSYARQLQRQDEDDFWWYEPPAQRRRKHPTLPVYCVVPSATTPLP